MNWLQKLNNSNLLGLLVVIVGGYVLLTSANAEFKNLQYDEKKSVSHPLVCVEKGDFPGGKELVYLLPESNKSIHAIFPKGRPYPEELNKLISAKGSFHKIENKELILEQYPDKNDYEVFVISSWEYEEENK